MPIVGSIVYQRKLARFQAGRERSHARGRTENESLAHSAAIREGMRRAKDGRLPADTPRKGPGHAEEVARRILSRIRA